MKCLKHTCRKRAPWNGLASQTIDDDAASDHLIGQGFCTQIKPIKLLPTKSFRKLKLHEAVSDDHLSDLILVKRDS